MFKGFKYSYHHDDLALFVEILQKDSRFYGYTEKAHLIFGLLKVYENMLKCNEYLMVRGNSFGIPKIHKKAHTMMKILEDKFCLLDLSIVEMIGDDDTTINHKCIHEIVNLSDLKRIYNKLTANYNQNIHYSIRDKMIIVDKFGIDLSKTIYFHNNAKISMTKIKSRLAAHDLSFEMGSLDKNQSCYITFKDSISFNLFKVSKLSALMGIDANTIKINQEQAADLKDMLDAFII